MCSVRAALEEDNTHGEPEVVGVRFMRVAEVISFARIIWAMRTVRLLDT